MAYLPASLDKLVQLLSRLPGIGDRSATRMAFRILADDGFAQELGAALNHAAATLRYCEACHTLSENERCRLCADMSRDRQLLCVVESVQDLLAFERTGAYRGLYHVLHGVLSPLKGIGPGQLKLSNLEDRVRDEDVAEVIIATNPDVEGEATALFLTRRLAPTGVAVSRIATGVPMGGDLEYIDQNTLTRALAGRTRLET